MNDIQTYLDQIERAYSRNDATEHTHRPFLKTLVESLQSGITATNEPKRIACNPFFSVFQQFAPPYIDFDFDHNILWITDWNFSSSKSLTPQPIVERD